MTTIHNPEYCRAVLAAAEKGTGLRFYRRTIRSPNPAPFARSILDELPPPKFEVETVVEFGDFSWRQPGPGEILLSAAQVKDEEPDAWAALQG